MEDNIPQYQGRPVWAEIDLDALAHNAAAVNKWIGAGAELLAVVKANAYGHGAVMASQVFIEAGARRLGVACVDEGHQLRQAGIQAPIVIIGHSAPWEAERIVRDQLTPTVTNKRLALALAYHSAQLGIITPVHIKVDTGMSRYGLAPEEVAEFATLLRNIPSLDVEGLYTHFASADEADKGFTRQQFRRFIAAAEQLPWIPYRHVANSATVLDLPEMHLDMVRPGICLYGLYPSRDVSHSIALKPALSLKSRVARVHTLRPGDSVSYGRSWIATRPTKVALVMGGYADGWPRILSSRGAVLIRGCRAPILGRICMDQFIVDVTHIPNITIDDVVVLIGRQGEEQITVEEVAEWANTINYEILCGISARVPRVYLKGGEVVALQTLTEPLAEANLQNQLLPSTPPRGAD